MTTKLLLAGALIALLILPAGAQQAPQSTPTRIRGTEKSDAPTLLRERLEIRLNDYLDSLFTRVNLDANRRIAKVNLVASSVLSSNNGVRHYDFGIDGRAIITGWRSADEPKRGFVATPSE